MSYAYTDAIVGYLVKQELSLERVLSEMNNQLMLYRQQTNQMQFNVLDSHDTPCLLHEIKGDKELTRQVLAFTHIQSDVPCLHHGDETGMTGDADPDCCRCMAQEGNQQDLDLKEFVKSLIALRRKYVAVFSGGTIDWTGTSFEMRLIRLACRLEEQTTYGVFNTGQETQFIDRTDREVLLSPFIEIASKQIMVLPKGFLLYQAQ